MTDLPAPLIEPMNTFIARIQYPTPEQECRTCGQALTGTFAYAIGKLRSDLAAAWEKEYGPSKPTLEEVAQKICKKTEAELAKLRKCLTVDEEYIKKFSDEIAKLRKENEELKKEPRLIKGLPCKICKKPDEYSNEVVCDDCIRRYHEKARTEGRREAVEEI